MPPEIYRLSQVWSDINQQDLLWDRTPEEHQHWSKAILSPHRHYTARDSVCVYVCNLYPVDIYLLNVLLHYLLNLVSLSLLFYRIYYCLLSCILFTLLLSTYCVSERIYICAPFLCARLSVAHPCHFTRSVITDTYVRSACWSICISLSWRLIRRWIFDWTIPSSILVHKKSHILDYSESSLKLRCEASICYADHYSIMGITPSE